MILILIWLSQPMDLRHPPRESDGKPAARNLLYYDSPKGPPADGRAFYLWLRVDSEDGFSLEV